MNQGRVLHWFALLVALGAAIVFLGLLTDTIREGLPHLTWQFLTTAPDERRGGGGIAPEIVNTVVMVGGALLVTAPLGLVVAIYQAEWQGRVHDGGVIDQVRATWLSVPSVVVGFIVYRVAVAWWHWPLSLATGGLALAVMNWPVMVTVSISALKRVPHAYREASLALGATRFDTVRRVVLPAALAELIDGWGWALARLAGESAALIITAGINVSAHWSVWGPGETLAVYIWYVRTEGVGADAGGVAAATALTLMMFIAVTLWLSGRLADWRRRAGH
ncbi:MAG: ABC transporter permease subunit [Firmicutes bacterium]|nr:ABC transporter permease subunit [Bacillota bacterium]